MFWPQTQEETVRECFKGFQAFLTHISVWTIYLFIFSIWYSDMSETWPNVTWPRTKLIDWDRINPLAKDYNLFLVHHLSQAYKGFNGSQCWRLFSFHYNFSAAQAFCFPLSLGADPNWDLVCSCVSPQCVSIKWVTPVLQQISLRPIYSAITHAVYHSPKGFLPLSPFLFFYIHRVNLLSQLCKGTMHQIPCFFFSVWKFKAL